MGIDGRPYRGLRSDDALIADLLSSQPGHARHIVDQPWRLASPDTQSGRFARLWPGPSGQLAGFAAWQTPWASLDLYVRDGPHRKAVLDDAFGWAVRLFRALDAERGKALPYWLECRTDDDDTAALAAALGFALASDRYVGLEQSLDSTTLPARPPAGIALRQLAGHGEAAAYAELHRAAFGTGSMTGEWRARMLQMPQYRADLDLVAVNHDGRLAGFVVGWLDPARSIGQVEPLGVHPEFTRRGVSEALLGEILARFRGHGATLARVETEPANLAAIRAYQRAGFRAAYAVRAYGKFFSP
jgi:mycothiol synthase